MKETPHDPQNGNTRQTEQRKEIKGWKRKDQVSYKNRPIKITTDFRVKTLKARRAWNEIMDASSDKCTSESTNHNR